LPNSIPIDVGIPNKMLSASIGIVKAYTTRVGAGGFVSEMNNELGEEIRQKGKEFGTVSGRARRIG
jgi:adenylosuccinate synthase